MCPAPTYLPVRCMNFQRHQCPAAIGPGEPPISRDHTALGVSHCQPGRHFSGILVLMHRVPISLATAVRSDAVDVLLVGVAHAGTQPGSPASNQFPT